MSNLSREEIEQTLEALNIKKSKNKYHPGAHAIKYNGNAETFYLKINRKAPLVVHPRWHEALLKNLVDGIQPKLPLPTTFYKNAGLITFPRLDKQSKTPCGCDVEVRSVEALEALLVYIGVIKPLEQTEATALAEIRLAEPQLATLSSTEREAVIAARMGQGRFRAALLRAWSDQCAVTSVGVLSLVKASHIKPWRDSDNDERLDPENGFLLVATLDAAFDAGLISFEDDGTMLFSPMLPPPPHAVLSVLPGCCLTRSPSSRQQSFLRYHRDHVFRVVSSKSVPLRR